ncbi:alpha/beta hydrolase [Sandaracinus amylolyticus]|uniref:alpha/beta hydrolase n=1 Tax=Sandaracinus amylolyticus TaxID=927083 RepID=UPI001F3BE3D2|nr:alpha/beta hydrolase [Sandaracinus amylolyticus]
MRRVAIGAILVVIMVFGFATRLQRALLFHPDAAPTNEAIAARVPGLERWWHESEEGRVEAWFIPGDGVSAESPGPLVIYAHGNAEVIDPLPLWLGPYRTMGISVLLPEYRGYGRSEGTPSERAIREDLVAFHDRAVARPEVDPSRVVLHGVSLGGGAVAQLTRERPPAAMILQSTFASVAEIAWELYRAPRFLISDPFDTIRVLRGTSTPVLLLHGRRDTVVPFAHSERLQRALPRSELVACDAGHNDLPPADLDYWGEIRAFLERSDVLR